MLSDRHADLYREVRRKTLAALIAAQRAEYGVPHAVCCRALGVSQAWFYKWRDGDRSARRHRRKALAATIAWLFTKHNRTYGSPRITADLRDMGWRVSKNTVAKLMAKQGLVARRKRHRRGSTKPDRSARKAPDLLRRDFTAPERPNVRWCGDLTEIPTDEGKLQRRCWICLRGGWRGSPWTSTTTRHWPGRRCAWPSRCAAAVCAG
jgi:hypothetical protein